VPYRAESIPGSNHPIAQGGAPTRGSQPQVHYAMNTRASRERREERISSTEAAQNSAQPSQAPELEQRIGAFPDPWLFESEKLIRELDRCREMVLLIPTNGDLHATHFGINNAISAIWNLREQIRYLLHLHREGQREFAKKAHPEQTQFKTPAPVVKPTKQIRLAG